jgi:ubiquinone/menaquinone biosynthesis C-methylase UbiE
VPDEPLVLDIGCGSGEPIGHYLIANGCKLTGVDSSSSLIEICKSWFPNERWVVQDMRELSLNHR